MTTTDKPEGLIAGGEPRAKASHNTPPAEEDRGEREKAFEIAQHIVAYTHPRSTAVELLLARALLSSPRVERRKALEEAAKLCEATGDTNMAGGPYTCMEALNADRAAAATAYGLAQAIRSLSPQGE